MNSQSMKMPKYELSLQHEMQCTTMSLRIGMRMRMKLGKFEFHGRWGVRLSFPSEIHAIHVSKLSPSIDFTNREEESSSFASYTLVITQRKYLPSLRVLGFRGY